MLTPLSPDHADVLKEVVNIAMGQAGDSLARTLDSFIQLSTPTVRLVQGENMIPALRELVGNHSQLTVVRQAFFPQLRGEALVLFLEGRCRELAELMGYEGELELEEERELLLDIANILVGAVLKGITETLAMGLMDFSPPSIIGMDVPVDQVIEPGGISWSYALLVEINFSLEERAFKSHMLLFMAEPAIEQLCSILDDFMESL